MSAGLSGLCVLGTNFLFREILSFGVSSVNYSGCKEKQYGSRSQLFPLTGRIRYGYTYTQNSSPIYWGVKLTNHVELLLLMSACLDYCLSFQETLN